MVIYKEGGGFVREERLVWKIKMLLTGLVDDMEKGGYTKSDYYSGNVVLELLDIIQLAKKAAIIANRSDST